jgi:hypothetical protein
MVDRNDFDSLVEIGDRIAASFHHFAYETVGLSDRTLGVVDELGLYVVPAVSIVVSGGGGERANLELLAFFFAELQNTFTTPDVAFLADHTVIFRPKSLAQAQASTMTEIEP